MNIKEILLNGGSVKFSYKEKEEDWVSEDEFWDDYLKNKNGNEN